MLRALEEAILKQGIGIGNSVVKVDMFLNHRIDTDLLTKMGAEIAEHFAGEKPDIVLTVEASGIALAVACGIALGNIPVVFAKKSKASNQAKGMLSAKCYSFTHQKSNHLLVDPNYLPKNSKVLIVDDFLANGEAIQALMSLIQQANCKCVGAAVAIEKAFQPGGQALREKGMDILSLASVKAIEDGKIVL
ncbi:MAG: xanthine phosphoribosyltransferase [Christensenellales bacterium]